MSGHVSGDAAIARIDEALRQAAAAGELDDDGEALLVTGWTLVFTLAKGNDEERLGLLAAPVQSRFVSRGQLAEADSWLDEQTRHDWREAEG